MIVVRDLDIRGNHDARILRGISLTLEHGQALAAVGASGAGKTTLGLALLGFVRPGIRRVGGTVELDGQNLFELPDLELRRLRREAIAYLPQNPAARDRSPQRVARLGPARA